MLSASKALEDIHDLLLQTGGVLLSTPDANVDDADTIGTLSMSLRYPARQELHVEVTVDVTPGYPLWVSYSFHLQNAAGRCIVRWDNAPHYPDLPTFPHHIHLGPREFPEACPLMPLHALVIQICNAVSLGPAPGIWGMGT